MFISVECDKSTGVWSVVTVTFAGELERIFSGTEQQCREYRRGIFTGKIKLGE